MRELRKSLDLVQDDFTLGHAVMSKIEAGDNKATSAAIQEALARGLGTDPETLKRFWRGELSHDEMRERCAPPKKARTNEVAARGALVDGALRWRALLELVRVDGFSGS